MSKEKARSVVNRIIDGTQVFWHDLFKSDVQMMIKNIFNRELQQDEDLRPTEHVHYFHSHDSNGRPQEKCVAVGGHYHKITTTDKDGNPLMDSNGRPKIVCSKPYRQVKVRRGRKMVTVEEEVTFKMEKDGKTMVDDHTHTFHYEKSQELSPDKIEQMKRQNARGIIQAFEGQPQVKGTEPPGTTSKDTATIS